MQPSQTMTTYSLVRYKKNKILTYQPFQHIIIIHNVSITILPPVGKEYMCFMKGGKSDQTAECIKSRITTKVIDSVLSTDIFEQQRVVLKGMLQSP